MYLPEAFRPDDPNALAAQAALYPFATVVTEGPGGLCASHLPLLVAGEGAVLRGHLARENPQLTHLAAGANVLAIFHGPHGYVSPSVYTVQPSVPTWNYVVIHARGRARLLDEERLRVLVDDMVTRFDGTGWHLSKDEAFLRPMLDAIAGFEIDVEKLEGKWKLSQNRTTEEQARVAAWLEGKDPSSQEIGALMRRRLG